MGLLLLYWVVWEGRLDVRATTERAVVDELHYFVALLEGVKGAIRVWGTELEVASTAARACLPAVLRRSWPTELCLWDMCMFAYVNFLLTLTKSQEVLMLARR